MDTDQNSVEQHMRDHFIGWQCRIRQYAVRNAGGRPSEGMRATVFIDDEAIAKIIVLINKKDLAKLVTEFSFMYKKNQDPAVRRDSILRVLMAGYFQYPEEFSDRLTALLSASHDLTKCLLEAGEVSLYFYQQNQQYQIPCTVHALKSSDHEYQATYWHNSLFNPNIPTDIHILAFEPDWSIAKANPLPNALKLASNFQ